MTALRLGAVGYLNARPLVYGLERSSRFDVRFDVPSVCADLLHEGGIDVGLIPSIEYLRGPSGVGHYRIVPDLAIASRGEVASVALYTRRPVSDVRSIAMDTSSRTSVALVSVLCAKLFKIQPAIESRTPDVTAMLADCDAALIIGDNALLTDPPADHPTAAAAVGTPADHPTAAAALGTPADHPTAAAALGTPAVRRRFGKGGPFSEGGTFTRSWKPDMTYGGVSSDGETVERIDLGEAWTTWTGLPFVYAFWAGRAGPLKAADVEALQKARDAGVLRSDEIARDYFPDAPVHQAIGARYLRDNIKYSLGDEERAGLELFYRYAAEIGDVASAGVLQFF
jgi:predicted solute-binding protein